MSSVWASFRSIRNGLTGLQEFTREVIAPTMSDDESDSDSSLPVSSKAPPPPPSLSHAATSSSDPSSLLNMHYSDQDDLDDDSDDPDESRRSESESAIIAKDASQSPSESEVSEVSKISEISEVEEDDGDPVFFFVDPVVDPVVAPSPSVVSVVPTALPSSKEDEPRPELEDDAGAGGASGGGASVGLPSPSTDVPSVEDAVPVSLDVDVAESQDDRTPSYVSPPPPEVAEATDSPPSLQDQDQDQDQDQELPFSSASAEIGESEPEAEIVEAEAKSESESETTSVVVAAAVVTESEDIAEEDPEPHPKPEPESVIPVAPRQPPPPPAAVVAPPPPVPVVFTPSANPLDDLQIQLSHLLSSSQAEAPVSVSASSASFLADALTRVREKMYGLSEELESSTRFVRLVCGVSESEKSRSSSSRSSSKKKKSLIQLLQNLFAVRIPTMMGEEVSASGSGSGLQLDKRRSGLVGIVGRLERVMQGAAWVQESLRMMFIESERRWAIPRGAKNVVDVQGLVAASKTMVDAVGEQQSQIESCKQKLKNVIEANALREQNLLKELEKQRGEVARLQQECVALATKNATLERREASFARRDDEVEVAHRSQVEQIIAERDDAIRSREEMRQHVNLAQEEKKVLLERIQRIDDDRLLYERACEEARRTSHSLTGTVQAKDEAIARLEALVREVNDVSERETLQLRSRLDEADVRMRAQNEEIGTLRTTIDGFERTRQSDDRLADESKVLQDRVQRLLWEKERRTAVFEDLLRRSTSSELVNRRVVFELLVGLLKHYGAQTGASERKLFDLFSRQMSLKDTEKRLLLASLEGMGQRFKWFGRSSEAPEMPYRDLSDWSPDGLGSDSSSASFSQLWVDFLLKNS